jgi:hypothetical protein
MFAGTNSDISIELVGDLGSSGKRYIKPSLGQLEAGRNDRFSIKTSKNIGNLNNLIVGKEFSIKLFSDWYLDKVIFSFF